jgi:UDP-GlcNAc:undecaprenyl-phosphate/decaprenyl-phosphate GlcNAc-1-phosphate transferase
MFALTLLVAALCGFGFAVLVGSNAMRIGRGLDLLDLPDGDRKLHARATPLVGGIAVGGASVVGGLLSFWQGADSYLLWLIVAVTVMFGIGVVDDRRHLPPVTRLLAAVSLLLIVIAVVPEFRVTALRFASMSHALPLGLAGGVVFTLLCLVGLLNAVNMADGKDGIVAGMALVWTLILAAHASPVLLPFLVATGVALAVIGAYNMAGKLFLGDGGSYAVSALFGLLAITIYNQPGSGLAADDVALLFVIPVVDTIRLMAARMARGQSPFTAGRDHLHHFIYARIGWPLGLAVYLALVALPNAGALVWPGSGFAWLAASVVAYAAVIVALRGTASTGAPAE